MAKKKAAKEVAARKVVAPPRDVVTERLISGKSLSGAPLPKGYRKVSAKGVGMQAGVSLVREHGMAKANSAVLRELRKSSHRAQKGASARLVDGFDFTRNPVYRVWVADHRRQDAAIHDAEIAAAKATARGRKNIAKVLSFLTHLNEAECSVNIAQVIMDATELQRVDNRPPAPDTPKQYQEYLDLVLQGYDECYLIGGRRADAVAPGDREIWVGRSARLGDGPMQLAPGADPNTQVVQRRPPRSRIDDVEFAQFAQSKNGEHDPAGDQRFAELISACDEECAEFMAENRVCPQHPSAQEVCPGMECFCHFSIAIKCLITEDDAKQFDQMRAGGAAAAPEPRYGQCGAIRQVRYLPDKSASMLFCVAELQKKLLSIEDFCHKELDGGLGHLEERLSELENIRSILCECVQGGRGSDEMPRTFECMEACLAEVFQNALRVSKGEPLLPEGPLSAIYRRDQERMAFWADPAQNSPW